MHKVNSYFTKHKDKTTTTETKKRHLHDTLKTLSTKMYMKTSKKIETRITEHKNAIKRRDLAQLPAAHTYNNCHTYNWKETHLLGQARTKHAGEFKDV